MGFQVRIEKIETIAIREPEPSPVFTAHGSYCTAPWDTFRSHVRPQDVRSRGFTVLDGQSFIGGERISNVVVRVVTDDGVDGHGMVGLGSPASIPLIHHHLEPLLVGQNPFDVERLWEIMFRTTLNIGRKGLVLEAISAIDIALWDIMGKATGQPLYNLLGGRTRDTIRAYASQLYATADLDALAEEARGYVQAGFTAMKLRFGYGPREGRPGMRANYELVRTVREAAGPDIDLMADAYMGWDVGYAIAMIRMLDELELDWVEEPVIPHDLEGYARIRRSVRTPIAGGEHEATRYGYRDMIRAGAVDILQPDVNRMGGITEARKVWALAAAHDIPVIPHAPDPHNAHLIMAHMNSPMIEYFPRGEDPPISYNLFAVLFAGAPEAVGGYLDVSDRPGLGLTPNAAAFDDYRVAS